MEKIVYIEKRKRLVKIQEKVIRYLIELERILEKI